MKKNQSIIEILKKVGAILENDHFVYTSGKHGSVYINKDFLYPHPEIAGEVGKMFAQKFKDLDVEVVVSPAIGGTILAQWTAFHLGKLKKREILAVYTEKDKGTGASAAESKQIFRRGYDRYVRGKKVLVIEDLTTTGGSVKKTIETTEKAGGKVVAVGVMVNRDPENINEKTIGKPFFALGVYPAKAYDPKDCPLCRKKIPINTEIGHGKSFLEKEK